LSVAEGGSRYDPANLVAACVGCNARHGRETLAELQSGRRLVGAGVAGRGERGGARFGAIR
jgi:MarR-like DNA-binding transcriptional regulator SgrR of sgrS sRNA